MCSQSTPHPLLCSFPGSCWYEPNPPQGPLNPQMLPEAGSLSFYLYLFQLKMHTRASKVFSVLFWTQRIPAKTYVPSSMLASSQLLNSSPTVCVCACMHACVRAHTHTRLVLHSAQNASKVNKYSQPASSLHLPDHRLTPAPAPSMKFHPFSTLSGTQAPNVSSPVF